MPPETQYGFTLQRTDFQKKINGHSTDLYFLSNEFVSVAFTNYGARVVGLIVHDKEGNPVDVVLGFDTLQDYLDTTEVYHGAIIGRYANRIAHGRFTLNGKEFKLAVNNGRNHLHGGPGGFHNMFWEVEEQSDSAIRFRYISPDGEEGYPGRLEVVVTYQLKGSALRIVFEAHTDKPTVINLTNHAYFNLNGSGSIEKHMLEINADQFTPIDEYYIPTGIYMPVASTPFDFRVATEIGSRINADDIQLRNGGGYDHNFVLNKGRGELFFAAAATGDVSGIRLEVYTTEPGLQLYTGNFMRGEFSLKGGRKDDYRTGFCLETQHFPDSPNQPGFPSVVLQPDEVFHSETCFSFSRA